MSESRIEEAFEDGPAFIPYLAAGDPNIESTKEYVRALVRGDGRDRLRHPAEDDPPARVALELDRDG